MAIAQMVPPIAKGYAYRTRLHVTGGEPPFPAGCVLRAEVRAFVGSPQLAGVLSTADGTIVRVDDETVELVIAGSITAAVGSNAHFDIARIDVSPDQWIGVQVQIPVVTPVTVAGPDA